MPWLRKLPGSSQSKHPNFCNVWLLVNPPNTDSKHCGLRMQRILDANDRLMTAVRPCNIQRRGPHCCTPPPPPTPRASGGRQSSKSYLCCMPLWWIPDQSLHQLYHRIKASLCSHPSARVYGNPSCGSDCPRDYCPLHDPSTSDTK